MFQLDNATVYAAELLPLADRDGSDVGVAVVKATYSVNQDGSLSVSDQQDPVLIEDQYEGEPGESALVLEADTALFKPGTDVFMIGTAQAPKGGRPRILDVTVNVGKTSKTVRVFGDRRWRRRLPFGLIGKSPPKPFQSMALSASLAFGGQGESAGRKGRPSYDERNPFGRGFHLSKRAVMGSLLPNLENPRQPIRSWKQRPVSWHFGCVPRTAPSRRKLAGTFGDDWFEKEMPQLPRDFDYHYFQGAGPGLVIEPWLKGNEEVSVSNVRAEGLWRFKLPGILIGVGAVGKGVRPRVLANLDTLVLRPDEGKVQLIWRRKVPTGGQHTDLQVVRVFELHCSARRLWEPFLTEASAL